MDEKVLFRLPNIDFQSKIHKYQEKPDFVTGCYLSSKAQITKECAANTSSPFLEKIIKSPIIISSLKMIYLMMDGSLLTAVL